MSKAVTIAAKPIEIEKERVQFKQLILQNPNYFGNLPASVFKPVKLMAFNTKYEELTCVGFNLDANLLEATIAIKLPHGYGGNLCLGGSTEYVRFFLNYGSGWEDAGVAAVNVHDIPDKPDCAGHPNKPLTYVLTLPIVPKRDLCGQPVLPKVRAILSWDLLPPPGPANVGWSPPWGNALESSIQIKPRWWVHIADFVAHLVKQAKLPTDYKVPPEYEPVVTKPIPVPDMPPPLSLHELVQLYQTQPKAVKLSVEPHRFGLTAIHEAIVTGTFAGEAVSAKTLQWKSVGVDLAAAIEALNKTSGDVSYEELECLGLDYHAFPEVLVATFRVKRPVGYCGNLCQHGSFEYVSFWADWDNTCQWAYLGTVSVKVHDISSIPSEGLCYSVRLPVDLTYHRNDCSKPKIGRVRAVLSWAKAPSEVDPDELPYWGNRLDTHVQIPPGPPLDPGVVKPIIHSLGEIVVTSIYNTAGPNAGMTKSTADGGAVFGYNGLKADDLGRPCPFGGRVVVKGPLFPGYKYRVSVKRPSDPPTSWAPLKAPLFLEKSDLTTWTKYPDTPDGYYTYDTDDNNFHKVLGYWDTSGDELWQVQLDIDGKSATDIHLIQLDNTAPTPPPYLSPPTVDVHIDSGGDCKDFTKPKKIEGHFVARDANFGSYSLYTLPSGPPPIVPGPIVPSSGSVQTAPSPGDTWELDTSGMLPCGYVVVCDVCDRSIINSSWGSHNWGRASVGFCLREKT